MGADLKISVITVCKNAEAYIRECIESVVSQDYPNVEYIVIDGKSTDGTIAVIEEYKSKIHIVKSEEDKGAADALLKGFGLASGDVLCWLNADDKFHPYALSTVVKIFSDLPQVNWITGFPTWYTTNGACVNELYNPDSIGWNPFEKDIFYPKFNRWSVERYFSDDFLAIQQESTFWRKELWQKSGAQLEQNTIAFDFELWTRFFQHDKLFTAPVVLSGFRVHGNQLSADRSRYVADCENMLRELKRKQSVPQQILVAIRKPFALMFKPFYYLDTPLLKKVYPLLMKLPPLIQYDENKDNFYL